MVTYKGSAHELGIEVPEGLSILTGRNIVPGLKKRRQSPPPAGDGTEDQSSAERQQPAAAKPRRDR